MKQLQRWLASEWFFRFILGVFILEAVWVVATLAYPGIFDESWHYQIIGIHAQSLWPVLTTQDPSTFHLGSITHDPSFLYHYLLSLPYRGLQAINASDTTTQIVLRLINVLFFTAALVVFRRLFFAVGASRAVSHLLLLFFILIPVVPFLAAQINNDNLVVVWVALCALLLVLWRQSVRNDRPSVLLLALLIIAALMGAMTQYVFLPILAFVGLHLAWDFVSLWRTGRLRHIDLRPLLTRTGIIVLLTALAAVGLFLSSYGYNLVRHHSPVPACDKVLTVEQCLTYYTYERNYTAEHSDRTVDGNVVKFTAGWLYRLYTTSFYTVLNGAKIPLQVPPFPLPAVWAAILLLTGTVLFVLYHSLLLQRYPQLGSVLAMGIFFVAILWLHNYEDFLHLKQKVGINGRYLLMVTPLLMLPVGLAFQRYLRFMPRISIGLLVLSGLLFFHGGGVVNYIVASDAAWWWPSPIVHATAQTIHNILVPLVIRFNLFW